MKQFRNHPPLPLAVTASVAMCFAMVVSTVVALVSHHWMWAVVYVLSLCGWVSICRGAEARYHRRWLAWKNREDVFPHCPNCGVRANQAHTDSCYIPDITNHERVWSGEWPTIDFTTEDGRRGRA